MQVDRRTFLGFSTLATAGVLVDGWAGPLWAQDVRGLPLTKDVATTAGRVRGVVRFGVNQFWGVPYAASTEGETNVLIERTVSELDGHKSLYSDAFYTRDEFDDLYGGAAYRSVKTRYDPDARLLELYEKAVQRR